MKSHGHASGGKLSPTYTTWWNMVNRCNPATKNPDNLKYYVGKGIKVYEPWLKFENFLADMGERPTGFTIDRIDSSKGYEPANCRWVTTKEQRLNCAPRTHCKWGHEYTSENTYTFNTAQGPKRRCRTCSRMLLEAKL